jgi:hypothetical protein
MTKEQSTVKKTSIREGEPLSQVLGCFQGTECGLKARNKFTSRSSYPEARYYQGAIYF